MLDIAIALLILIGFAHSILGERYILIRLFRRDDLPKIYGSAKFTTRTLRFAWHITTIAWWGFAAILFQISHGDISVRYTLITIGVTFIVTGLMALIGSRAQHFAWPIFLLIGSAALYAANL